MLAHLGWLAYGPGVDGDYHTGRPDCTCGECVMRRYALSHEAKTAVERERLAAEWERLSREGSN